MMRIVVAGGGIGGLAVALRLAQHGLAVHVLERASEFGEIGAGIQLAPNASWALERLGVLADVHAFAVFPERIRWMDAISGAQLTELDLGRRFRARYGFAYVVMHRSDLLAVLLRACRADARVTLDTNKVVTAVDDCGDTVAVTCADGTRYEADVLIGADGLRSVVRATVVGDGEPVCSAYVAYRGAIPIGEIDTRAGLDTVMLWTGPQMHLVQYPVRRGELYNQVAVFRSDRYRPDADDWGTPDELDARFAAGTAAVHAALRTIKRDRRWPMFDRVPIGCWTSNRITLLGDAAHPMLQYLAQGACQALEDAIVLADALAAGDDDPGAAFAAYERERVDRTARVQTLARAWGDYWHLDPGPERAARDLHLARREPADFRDTDGFYAYRGASG